MVKLIKIVPLILSTIMACSPLTPPNKNLVAENGSSDNTIIRQIENDEKKEDNINLDLSEPFEPKEYEIEDAFPSLSFQQPVLLTYANEDEDAVYVVEKTGKIKRVTNAKDVESANIFLDLGNKVDSDSGEKGLLGLAFHPNYKKNGFYYINYTNKDSTIIARYNIEGKEEILLKFSQPFSNHNGGHLAFGPDGYLYIATGDGGSGGDPNNNAQNKKTYLGKILRIDVDNPIEDKLYSIPDDNPFKNNSEGYVEEIYAYGLRNPWRFSFDNERNIVIAADVGQDKIEEINIIKNGGNYGWSIMEGNKSFKKTDTLPEDLIPPIWEYDHSLGRSITGGYSYYGKENESLVGIYIYGDFISGKIWGLWIDKDNNISNHHLLDTNLMISSFGLDNNGEIYIVDFNGKIYSLIEK